MNVGVRSSGVLSAVVGVLLVLNGRAASAQTADAGRGGEARTESDSMRQSGAVGESGTGMALPPGHPSVGGRGESEGHGGQGAGVLHRADLPRTFAEERADVPVGTVRVRVVNGEGVAQRGVEVRLGEMRDGEPGPAVTRATGEDGMVEFTGLERGSVAYRVSTVSEGAKVGSVPFQLTQTGGYRVQLVRHAVRNDPRGILIWDARVESRFRGERLAISVRLRLANLSAMMLGAERPQPFTYVPTGGLRFRLPEGATAFTASPSMDDARLTREGDEVVFHGSVAPTVDQLMEMDFQFQVKLHGGDLALSLSLPLPSVNVGVATEAPPGLGLRVEGFSPAEERQVEGQRVLLTTLSRQPGDPPLEAVRWRLTGIPRAAGPMRLVATVMASVLVLFGVFLAVSRRARGARQRGREVLDAEREAVLGEFKTLVELHREGEVGPVTYERRRRELTRWLAALMKESHDASTKN